MSDWPDTPTLPAPGPAAADGVVAVYTDSSSGDLYDDDFAGHPYKPASSGSAMRGRCVWQNSRTGMQCGGRPDHDWHLMFGRANATDQSTGYADG